MYRFVLVVGSMEKSRAYVCSNCGLDGEVACIYLF